MEKEKHIFVDKPIFKVLGYVCTIASLLAAIFTFCNKSTPLFEYELISKIQILNKNIDISSIHIMMDSIDIQKDSMNVSIVEIQISNNGRGHLSREDYDKSIFGLEIINGELLEIPEFTNFSSNHISMCCKQHTFGSNKSFIPIPIIPLDSQDYYQLKIVILHHSYKELSFNPLGKIIGQKEILVLKDKNKEVSLLKRVFDENLSIHFLRLFVYLIIIIAIIWVSVLIENKSDKIKQRAFIKQLRNDKNIDDEVINDYLNLTCDTFVYMSSLIKLSEKELYTKYKSSINYVKNEKNQINEEQWFFHSRRCSTIKMMLQKKYIKIDDEKLTINKKKKTSLLEIINKVYERNGYIPNMHYYNSKLSSIDNIEV